MWALVLRNERLLRREVARFLPKDRRHEFEELYSDVVYGRCCSIMLTYDPYHVPPVKPITHLCVNARWYAFKWVHAQARRAAEYSSINMRDVALRTYTEDHDGRLRVESTLRPLPSEMAKLLEWTHMKGFTPKEIADHTGQSIKEVKEELQFAEELARDYQGL